MCRYFTYAFLLFAALVLGQRRAAGAEFLRSAAAGRSQTTSATPEQDPAFATVTDDPALPRVLLIGDSISIGYTVPTRELLKGQVNVHRIPENGGPTVLGLEKLETWLGNGRWHVIHFNWGLHDLKYLDNGKLQVPRDEYEVNLRELVARLQRTGASLIWASTTPVPDAKVSPPRKNQDVLAYNAIASRVMQAKGVAIHDLYRFALPKLGALQTPANVHFTPEGSRALAQRVAAEILAAHARRRVAEAAEAGLPQPVQIPVFTSGKEGYRTFRIPALIVTQRGSLLAFCEGRKHGRSDSGDIDLLLKRSFDGGRTWGPLQVVADDGPNTMGNPCPVVDRATGTIWLPLTRNLGEDDEAEIKAGTSKASREVWLTQSTDDAATWSPPLEITASVKDPNWTWYATGPGNGIQLRSGRLLIPCDHAAAGSDSQYSHVIFSDDHGATWKLGGIVGEHTDECQVVERSQGSLLINMRSYHGKFRRAVAVSNDGGLTWSRPSWDNKLIEPVCQASFLRFDEAPNGGKSRWIFSNPASTERQLMTVRLSEDEGETWPFAKLLHAGPAAYSSLVVLPDQTIGCLYERGEQSPYETITFARCSLNEFAKEAGARTPRIDFEPFREQGRLP